MRRWLAVSTGAAVLLLAAGGVARAMAPPDPDAALKELNTWYTAQIQQGQGSGKQVDFRALMQQRTQKAKTLVSGMQASSTEPAKCMALAQLYQAAQMPDRQIEALQRFLGSNPEPKPTFSAQQMLLSAYRMVDDASGIVRVVNAMKPPDARSAAMLAQMVGGAYAETVADKLGPQAGLALIKHVEEQVPFDSLTTDQDKQVGERARVAIATGRADLLEKAGKRTDALASLKAALATCGEKSPAAGQLRSKIALMSIVGMPAPAITRERGYGEFPGLDKLKGKVVVLDFGAHW